ncbi:sugar ABC transporter substrate-binding protein [Spirochaetia bacterium]|nr:sugar ABC transporter substrate-binding protein [Spirochaetia bacterium]
MKRSVSIAILCLFGTALAFAGGGSQSKQSSGGGTTTVRWLMQVASEAEANQWRELAADVSKTYPEIKVEMSTVDWNGYWTKLPTELAGGNPPDILYMQVMRAKSYLEDGFAPIDDYIAADKTLNIGDFYPGILDGLTINGKRYCLPYDFGPYVLYYNVDLFDKHNVPYPDEIDYATYRKICDQLSTGGDFGAAIAANIDRSIPFIWGDGASFFDSRGRFVINNPITVAAIQKQAEMIRSGKAPRQTDTGNFQWDREQFYSGKVGTIPDGPWNVTNIKAQGNFKLGAAVVPKGDARRASPVAGSGFGISKGSKLKEEAYKAISVITNPASLTKLATWGRALPSRASVRNVYYEMHSDVRGLREAVERSCAPEIGIPYVTTSNWQEVYNTINQNIEPVFLGNMDAKTGLDNAQKIIDGILKQ